MPKSNKFMSKLFDALVMSPLYLTILCSVLPKSRLHLRCCRNRFAISASHSIYALN